MPANHIFLSYAKEDTDTVRRVHARLQKVGLRPWFDDQDLLPGQDWDATIRSAIRTSTAFVAFLSTRAVDKTGYVQREIREALEVAERMPEGRIFVVPVRLDKCVVPERRQRWHRIDLFKRGGYERLQKTLLTQGGSPSHQVVDAQVPLPTFKTSVDHVFYDIIVRSSRVVYAQLSDRRYAVGQGHFYVVTSDLPDHIMKLQRRITDFRKVSASYVRDLLKRGAPWRRDKNLFVRTLAMPGSSTIVAQSSTAIVGVDPRYWSLAMMLTRRPKVYIAVDNGDLLYIEENGRVVMIIAPRRLTDEDHAALRNP